MANHVASVLIAEIPGEGYISGDQFYPVIVEDIKKAERKVVLKDIKSYIKNASKKLKGKTINIVHANEVRDQSFKLVDVQIVNQ